MSSLRLRTQLTIGIVAVAFMTFVLLGYVAVVSTKGAVRDRLDERLLASIAADGDPFDGVVLEPDGEQRIVQVGDGLDVATFRIDDPAGLPTAGKVGYLNQESQPLQRATTVRAGERVAVVMTDAEDVRALVSTLINRFWLMGIGGSLAIALMSWWWIRRSTRPIERMIDRAAEIAAGSPERDLAVPSSSAELRELSTVLTAMLASVDEALAIRTESEERMRQFMADASHELRTPLTTISGYLQLDAEGALVDGGEHHRAIRRALDEARRMHRIVADLQLLTELDEVPPMLAARLDLASIAADAIAVAEALDAEREYRSDVEPAFVHGDADRLRQIVDNLLANTRRHTPAGTSVAVTVSSTPTAVTLIVDDSGPGVADEELASVFDRFWRHDRARTRASGGSGLGLAIVASIVHAHHGTLAAARSPLGGLAVTATFPVPAQAPAGIGASSEETSETSV
jgi:signal transduction histidine kinase